MSGVTAYVGEKAVELLAAKFKDSVIQRWSRHRAGQFMDALVIAVGEDELIGGSPEEVNRLLDRAMADDSLSAVLFDAYRRVCLSASRDIGPRIIGYLTARLVIRGGEPTDQEEAVFRAAEYMTDKELFDLAAFVEEKIAVAQPEDPRAKWSPEPKLTKDGGVIVYSGSEQECLDGASDATNVGTMNLAREWGAWAGKAEWLGLARQVVTAKTFADTGSDYHVGGGYVREKDWWLSIEPAGVELARMVRRCAPACGCAPTSGE